MTMSVAVRDAGPAGAWTAAAGLGASAVMTLLVPVAGAVRASDRSAVWFAHGALWPALLPAIVVAAVALRHAVAALAVAAGAGAVGFPRLLADLPIVTAPDSVARPELFVETTDRSLPFHAAGGGYLLLGADIVLLAAGVFAAWRLARSVTFPRDSDEVESRRNSAMMAVGFVGVLLIAVAALAVPYQGGYLSGRYVSVGLPLVGLVGAVVLAVLAAMAVLVAGSMPRSVAVALLGGVGAAAAVPSLTAIIAAWSAPVGLSFTVWLGVAGAAVLAAAGFLTRTELASDDGRASDGGGHDRGADDRGADDGGARDGEGEAHGGPAGHDRGALRFRPAGARRTRAATVVAAVLGLVAAALAVAAGLLPAIDTRGLGDAVRTADGSALPSSTAFWLAAIPIVVAAVLTLLPGTVGIGRSALIVVWAVLAPPMALSLDTLADGVVATARSFDLVRIGAGLWCGAAALTAAVAAALAAAVAGRRAREATTTIPDDEAIASARQVSTPLAAGLCAAALVMAFVPVYAVAGRAGPTILNGYTIATWGVWAALLATVGAAIMAAVTTTRAVVIGAMAAAVTVQAMRLVVAVERRADGVHVGVGTGAQILFVLILAVATVILALRVGRIRLVDTDDGQQPAARSRRTMS